MPNKFIDVWKRIDKKGDDECWEWKGWLNNGYGMMRSNYKYYYTHRLIYELTYGPISDGLFVLHHCDNRRCCNPKHLFLGTHVDNMKDKINKGRQSHPIGIKNNHCKLTELNVVEIRKLYLEKKYNQSQLGKIYDVGRSAINKIVHNKIWRN